MKQRLFLNWGFMRFLRMVLGVVFIIQAILEKDALFIILAAGFTAMPVFNVGCCSSSCSYVPPKR